MVGAGLRAGGSGRREELMVEDEVESEETAAGEDDRAIRWVAEMRWGKEREMGAADDDGEVA